MVDDLLILTLSPEVKLEAGDDSNDAANTAAPEKTIGEVFDTLSDEQKDAVYAVIAMAIDEKGGEDTAKHSDTEGDDDMKYNAFDQDSTLENENVLSHAEQGEIIGLAKKSNASLKDTFLAHYEEGAYGIQANGEGTYGIDMLFPEAKNTAFRLTARAHMASICCSPRLRA